MAGVLLTVWMTFVEEIGGLGNRKRGWCVCIPRYTDYPLLEVSSDRGRRNKMT